jgi:hypothetical protein
MENTEMYPSSTVSNPLFPRVAWGAIFAGVVTALATWGLLYMLGVGIGLSTIDGADTRRTAEAVGMGASIWSLIAPIIGLFVGGMMVGRMVGPSPKGAGVLYGTIVWAVGTIVVLFLLWSGVTAMLGMASDALGGQGQGLSGAGINQQTAMAAADDVGKGMIGVVISLVLAMGASIAGSTLSVRQEQKRSARLSPAAAH